MLTLKQTLLNFKFSQREHCATCRSALDSKSSLLELM